MEETERCELAVMTIQRRKLGRWVIYILLLLFRFLGVFQRGYVHPDEFFQGGQELFFGRNRHESDGRYLTRDFVVKSVPWEFESKHAVRSIVPPAFMTLLPLRLYATLRHRFSMSFLVDGDLVITGQESPRESSSSSLWMKSPAIENLSGVEILLVPRFFMAFLSVIFLDGSLWLLLSIAQRGTIRANGPPIEVLVLASSWPCLVFGMRTFTNCLESMMVAFLIVIVAAMVDCGETNHLKVKPTTKRMNDDAFFSLILIGATCSVGIFIRFTFSFFAFPVLVLFLWRRWKFLGGCRVKLMIHDVSLLSVSFLLVSFAFAWVDNQYYTRQSKSACDNNICEAEPEFSSGSMLDYIAPFNAFLYNSNPANLAKHGLHPRITHLAINMPMLFGPLALVGFGSFIEKIYGGIAGKSNNLHGTSDSFTRSVCQWAIFSGLVVLSCAPHQEPRFLLPAMVPLVFLYGRHVVGAGALATDNNSDNIKMRSKLFHLSLVLWIVFNIILYIFFGWLHQGGLLHSLLRLEKGGGILGGKSDASLPRAFIYYRTYMPATFLTRGRSRIGSREEACEVADGQCKEQCLDNRQKDLILDLQGVDSSVLLNVLREWLPCRGRDEGDGDISIQLVSPPAVILPLVKILEEYSFLSMEDYYGHISTEDWPAFDGSAITFLKQFKLELYTVSCGRSGG